MTATVSPLAAALFDFETMERAFVQDDTPPVVLALSRRAYGRTVIADLAREAAGDLLARVEDETGHDPDGHPRFTVAVLQVETVLQARRAADALRSIPRERFRGIVVTVRPDLAVPLDAPLHDWAHGRVISLLNGDEVAE